MIETAEIFGAVATRSVALVVAGVAVLAATATVATSLRTGRRRQAVEHLLERRLDLALEAGGMTTWLWHATEDTLSWDQRAVSVYGGDPPSAPAAWLETVHPDDLDMVEEALGERIGNPGHFHVVYRFESPSGDLRWLDMRGEPVLDDDGELLGAAGVVVDVTEERQNAAELAAGREALERILEVTPAFTSDDDPDHVPALVCATATEVFGCNVAGIWEVDGEIVRPIGVHPPSAARLLPPSFRRADFPYLRERVARSGPVHLSAAGAEDALAGQVLASSGVAGGIVAPLGPSADDRFLTLWWFEVRDRPGLAQLAVVQRFADQVALALALAKNRAAHDEVDRLNEMLQAGLVPRPAVSDPMVQVDARYQPGERRILVGGDFYDVVEDGEGGIAFVVGDVTGHGPGPAALGAALRSAWRAMVFADPDPVTWLTRLGDVLASYDAGPEMLVTVCTGRIDPDRRHVTVANAGHPRPMLLTPGCAEPLDVAPGVALGLLAPGAWAESTSIPLPAGWRVLLYTDGVIEVHAGPRPEDRLDQEGLASWLREHPPNSDGGAFLDALVAHLEQTNRAPLEDDVAVILIGVRPAPPPTPVG